MNKSLIRTWGRLKWCLTWHTDGYSTTSKQDHQHFLWFWIGSTVARKGDRLYNIVVGPIGFSFGFTKPRRILPTKKTVKLINCKPHDYLGFAGCSECKTYNRHT